MAYRKISAAFFFLYTCDEQVLLIYIYIYINIHIYFLSLSFVTPWLTFCPVYLALLPEQVKILTVLMVSFYFFVQFNSFSIQEHGDLDFSPNCSALFLCFFLLIFLHALPISFCWLWVFSSWMSLQNLPSMLSTSDWHQGQTANGLCLVTLSSLPLVTCIALYCK